MELPHDPGALTAPWLTAALRASGALDRARVQSFTWAPMEAGKGITGMLVRLHLAYDMAEAAAPATLVAKFSSSHPEVLAASQQVAVDTWSGFLGRLSIPISAEIEAAGRLVRAFHAQLVEGGVPDYPFEQCWDDYRSAMLLAVGRVSTAVGVQPGPLGGFWDVVFPRYAQALAELGVRELLEARRAALT